MKRKTLWFLLAAEAALCILLQLLKASFASIYTTTLAFPFEQIGLGLRALSLSGWAGNAAAVTLYAAICLTPLVYMAVRTRQRRLQREDWLLVALSAALFGVLYLMINPSLIAWLFGSSAAIPVGKAVLSGTIYSVVVAYAVLILLRLFSGGNTSLLFRYLAAMLALLGALFVYLAFGSCFGNLLDSFVSLQAGNAGSELLQGTFGEPLGGRQLGLSYCFLIIQFMLNALPYVLDVFIIFAALRLLDELRADRYSAASVAAASRLSRLCGMALAATAIASLAFNLLQLLFAKALLVINSTVQIPLTSLAFVLAVLLLARFVSENKQLKDDNDMFI